jgi:hypothetical protein
MTTQDAIMAELEGLPASALEKVAEFVRSVRVRSLEERTAAYLASFGSMPKDEADEFEKHIELGCERMDS